MSGFTALSEAELNDLYAARQKNMKRTKVKLTLRHV